MGNLIPAGWPVLKHLMIGFSLNNNLVPIGSAIICMCSPTDIFEQWERNFLLRSADVRGEGMHDARLRMSVEDPEQGFWRCFADGLNQSLVCLWHRLLFLQLCAGFDISTHPIH